MMHVRRSKRLFVAPLIVAVAFLTTVAAAQQEEAGDAYRQAYRLILDEQWNEAAQAFVSFVSRHPESEWTDDAEFWACYARERGGEAAQTAFSCYESLVERYPRSEWADDARRSMVELARKLSRQGHPEFLESVKRFDQSESDDDLLAVLSALAEVGDERSLQVLYERFDASGDERLRTNIVRILEDVEAASATTKLIEIVRTDQSWRVREEAVEALRWHGDPRVVEVLREIATGEHPRVLREAAIDGLAEAEDPTLIPFLARLAADEVDREVAETAIGALADIEHPQALDALISVYSQRQDRQLREEILGVMGGRVDALEFLSVTARTEQDPELVIAAVEAIADLEAPAALQVLLSLVSEASTHETRVAAVAALAELETDAAARELVSILHGSDDPRLRAVAAEAVAYSENALAVDALARAASGDASAEVRAVAVRALGDIGTAEAREALIELLDNRKGE